MIDNAIRQAVMLQSRGRVDDAVRLLADTLRIEPGAHQVSFQMALVLAQKGDWRDAERFARAAASVDHSYAAGFGEILANVGAFQEAEEWLRRALNANPRNAAAHSCLGAVYVHQKKLTEGLACIDAALAIQPDFPIAQINRTRVLEVIKTAKNARSVLEEYARNNGFDPDAIESRDIEFPSACVDSDGRVRFTLSLPGTVIVNDVGAAVLFKEEVQGRGWEFPLRKFLDDQLRSDDVFIDVGAHWGVHSLTAATTPWSNQVSVLAIEAHPHNVERLRSLVDRNGLERIVEVIESALGDSHGTARMRIDGSSMGHSLRSPDRSGSPTIEVPVTTLDSIIAAHGALRWRRVIMKIDVEGYEYEVLSGARDLLASGNVAAVIWENGEFYEPAILLKRRQSILDLFDVYHFAHYRFDHEIERLMPLSSLSDPCDVYSLSPDLRYVLAQSCPRGA